MTWPETTMRALQLKDGARFYKCALQVNPFDYLLQQSKVTAFQDEASYNTAIVEACKEQNIEIIAITDHYRIKTAEGLWKAAEKAGIYVFPGFEASTREGVHFLTLFDIGTDIAIIERSIGALGILKDDERSPIGKYNVGEFLKECRILNAICVAAHMASEWGILTTLRGKARIIAWKNPNLLVGSLPGPISDAPEKHRSILKNINPDYKRDRPLSIINAQDVNDPTDLTSSSRYCWIKMSTVSLEGLRQAFLDEGSRIRLASDPEPEEHTELVSITWEGGFLDGCAIHFNENLNVLIGGRGTGKSTVIESIRYVLGIEPLGEDAKKAHEGIIKNVIRSGTKISLHVCSYYPSKREYLIIRTVPNPSVVRDEGGEILDLIPSDILPKVEVYGQHEISELSKSPEKLTRLLDRFVEKDPNLINRKNDLSRELERSRMRFLEVEKESRRIEEQLAALPVLEETLERFKEAGLEDLLKEQSLVVREERILKTASERLNVFRETLAHLQSYLPVDRTFLSEKSIQDLPAKETLQRANQVLEDFDRALQNVTERFSGTIKKAEEGLEKIRNEWGKRKEQVQADYEELLRQLQKSRIDGEEFIQLKRQIENLRSIKERHKILKREIKELYRHRQNLLVEWEDAKASQFRELRQAGDKVSKRLVDRVQASVLFAGNREKLFQVLRERVGGRLSETISVLEGLDSISLKVFVEACRSGTGTLSKVFKIPQAQAQNMAESDTETLMIIEELDLPPTAEIKLNVAGEGQPAVWQDLDDLSTGQKATAILLLLLLESHEPLIVDQPEDDLDNRFITEGIVPKMREEKRIRQFIFATHNANIPVLGDSELIVGLQAFGEAGEGRGRAEIPSEHMGSIDEASVRELVEEVLEGGREAFEMRRLKYGF